MYDYGSGIDHGNFRVVADFAVDGVAGGENLAGRFQEKAQGVWELKLSRPLTRLEHGLLTVSVADRQGNVSRIERTFTVGGIRP
jgi:hypothetical protein